MDLGKLADELRACQGMRLVEVGRITAEFDNPDPTSGRIPPDKQPIYLRFQGVTDDAGTPGKPVEVVIRTEPSRI